MSTGKDSYFGTTHTKIKQSQTNQIIVLDTQKSIRRIEYTITQRTRTRSHSPRHSWTNFPTVLGVLNLMQIFAASALLALSIT